MAHTQEIAVVGKYSRLAHLVIGCTLIAVAVTATITALGFPETNLATDVGPARFPIIYASALIVLCLVLMASHVRPPSAAERASVVAPDKLAYLAVATGMVATALCIFAMSWLGYAITTVLYLTGLMCLMGWRHKWLTPVVAIGITALLYALFSLSLNVPLPVGSLFE